MRVYVSWVERGRGDFRMFVCMKWLKISQMLLAFIEAKVSRSEEG